MDISHDFERYPHGCEIVIPIVLKIPIYIEPVVIERTAVCHGNSHSEVAGLKNQLSEAGPVAMTNGVQTVANLTMDSSEVDSVNRALNVSLQTISKGWHSFSHAIQDLFETGMSGRARFLQE
ncbi:hypothetical protein [Leptothoe spongobia]|uniref:Uncharacterized protein n=1 Tax=Leptothoe spongobia TAU-MAC 1115 TaxID=1967444 RepID=A0A947DHD0_9CYAN|nr:hypothetical protein [Leptothoe spongobia]MBT9317093.1 hypothetical protein [Leptothoe spongobia TAU-MAC 1115]